ncbi:MAG: UDP-N-acetylmuramate dehydrogenase [Chromatiaceae bacterium]|nr:UDP-N-acetylmuramate dehydrogenase [Chromatiaceae bacterium]MCP5447829.1 UDP-N-acetylmuramate dehydrogenase [Chromatiaceae bacterium]
MAAMKHQPLRGELSHGVPLSDYTSWRVGGVAKQLYRPADSRDLIGFLQQLDAAEPLLWLGLGSNLLVRDGGFNGTVIATQGCLERLELQPDGLLYSEAGVSCAKVARFAARQGRVGIEFLAGIPGTMGGALAMNAGAFGGETWDAVAWVETVDRQGCVRRRDPSQFEVGYRSVKGAAGEWFLSTGLQIRPGDVAAGQQKIKQLLARRAETQPIGLPSCGSVFRNPVGDHAARLIEAAGLKGERIGGAVVSEKHANFIINSGAATANDIESLICLVRDRVEAASGVRLQTEVHMVGERRQTR